MIPKELLEQIGLDKVSDAIGGTLELCDEEGNPKHYFQVAYVNVEKQDFHFVQYGIDHAKDDMYRPIYTHARLDKNGVWTLQEVGGPLEERRYQYTKYCKYRGRFV